MRITHAIMASIARVRDLQMCNYQVLPKLRDGFPAHYWHTTDGVHYRSYQLSLQPTESNIYVSHNQVHPAQAAQRQLSPSIWCFIECDSTIIASIHGLTDNDVVYLGDENHYTVSIALDATLKPN